MSSIPLLMCSIYFYLDARILAPYLYRLDIGFA